MRDSSRRNIAIFKPLDEEAYAPNNPRGYQGKLGQQSFRTGVLSGEGAVREVCAYLLDTDNFSGVPATTMVEVYHPSFKNLGDSQQSSDATSIYGNVFLSEDEFQLSTEVSDNQNANLISPEQKKIGSLQTFVDSDDLAENYCSDLYSAQEVHKIAILDLRILNLDRNEGNILLKKIQKRNKKNEAIVDYKLIPIDHALSIPSSLEIYSYDICWMSWEQANAPFSK